MPLTTTWTRSEVSKCGCAFSSLTRPCVAQRVWPMPVVAGGGGGGDAAPPPPPAPPPACAAGRGPAGVADAGRGGARRDGDRAALRVRAARDGDAQAVEVAHGAHGLD